YCLNNYWDGKLVKPVNIIECKRLKNAVMYDWGDTNDITHHATVPLSDGEEQFGILNVAAPNKQYFSDEELTLLESIAYQIGTAVKRTRLYNSQKKRAENLVLLDEVARFISGLSNISTFPKEVVNKLHHVFQWPLIAFYLKKGNIFKLCASNQAYKMHREDEMVRDNLYHDMRKALSKKEITKIIDANSKMRSLGFPGYPSAIAVPII